MKKTYLYVLVLATLAVAAVSCVRLLDGPQPIKGDHTIIRLTPVVASPVTKANEPTTEVGEDLYNENTITDYYWYIFSDEEGTELKLSGYVSSDASTEILLDNAFPDGGIGYVYVAANLPEAPGSDVTTLEDLRKISFGTDMPTTYTQKSEFYEYTSATTGLPKPDKFVMRTENPVAFELEEKTIVPVTANLKRVAAKVILELHVAQVVRQMKTGTQGQEEYVKTWTSDMEHLQVYMLWGSTHGDLNGTKFSYSSEHANWFYSASPRYAMYDDANGNPSGGVFTNGAIIGSIPSSRFNSEQYLVNTTVWDYVYQVNTSSGDNGWIWNDNASEDDKIDENRGNYYYGDWAYVSSDKPTVPDPETGNAQRQRTTQTAKKPYWAISSRPLYSMPISWNVNDAHAPFIKVIIPWLGSYEEAVGGHSAGDVDDKTTEFYYKILVPNRTTLDANNCYRISLDISVLGSEADDVPVALSGEYHVVDWNQPQHMGGDQAAGVYFNVAEDTFDMYSNTLTIPVSSSGPIIITAFGSAVEGTEPSASYPLGTSNSTNNLVYSTASSTGTNFMVTPDPNGRFVKVDHTVLPFSTSFSATNGNQKDIAKITYKFRVSLKGHPDFYKDITVTQYPSIYVARRESNGRPFVNRISEGSVTNNTNSYSLGSVSPNGYGSLYNTIVSISTLAGLSSTYPDWVIGDPRIRLADAYNGIYQNVPSYHNDHGNNSDNTEWLRTDLGSATDYFDNYLVGDKDASNFIAPKFMLASGYGYNSSAGSGSNWKTNSERCASYQEDGYPAGRWRVPTEAELLFCATLASNRLIENPFRGSTSYWATSGRALNYADNSANWSFSPTPTNNARSVRCVYDLWYWGDEPVVTPGNYAVMLPE